jgi:plasmid stability protein
MKNITLAVDDDVLKNARIYAAEQETSINNLVRDFLARLATEKQSTADQEARAARARRELAELSRTSPGRLGPNWKWNRDDIYSERLSGYERTGLRSNGTRRGGEKKSAR